MYKDLNVHIEFPLTADGPWCADLLPVIADIDQRTQAVLLTLTCNYFTYLLDEVYTVMPLLMDLILWCPYYRHKSYY